MLSLRRAFIVGVTFLNKKLAQTCGILLCGTLLCATANALLRYIFHITFAATLELQGYFFSAVFLLAGAYVLHTGHHIRVDVLFSHMSARLQRRITLFGHICLTLPVAVVVIATSIPWAYASYLSHETSINVGGLLIWPAKLLICVSFILIALQACAEVFHLWDEQAT